MLISHFLTIVNTALVPPKVNFGLFEPFCFVLARVPNLPPSLYQQCNDENNPVKSDYASKHLLRRAARHTFQTKSASGRWPLSLGIRATNSGMVVCRGNLTRTWGGRAAATEASSPGLRTACARQPGSSHGLAPRGCLPRGVAPRGVPHR